MDNKIYINKIDKNGNIIQKIELTLDEYNSILIESSQRYIGKIKYHPSSNRIEIVDNPINIKTIAVVCKTIDSFHDYIKANNIEPKKGGVNTNRRIDTEDCKYICVTIPTHGIGYNIDSILELDNAYLNPNYEKIIENLKQCLRR